MYKGRSLALQGLLALGLANSAFAHHTEGSNRGATSHVYVLSNNAVGNSVAVLKPNFLGSLDKIDSVPTGGNGTGPGELFDFDPLGSQNALVLSEDGHWLFAVNAGSNEISMFHIQGDHLYLVSVVPSGGTYPVSLAQHGDVLYVLNAANQANVTQFRIGSAGLTPLEDIRYLGVNAPLIGSQPSIVHTPTQLEFSPDGKSLAITVKDFEGDGSIHVFDVGPDGALSDTANVTISHDQVPFGFTFDNKNHLLVSEALGSAASSYEILPDKSLRDITKSSATGQMATCWVATNNSFVYFTNSASDTISGYRLDEQGQLTLISDGVSASFDHRTEPTDIKFSKDGHRLYVVTPGTGGVSTFSVGDDGQLTLLGATPLFESFSGTQGLAVQ